MAEKSRAEYFRELRKAKKQLVFMVDKEKAEALDRKLAQKGESRTEWFRINKGEIVTLIGPNGSGKNSTKNSVNKKGRPPSRQEVVDAQITKPFGLINSFYQASEGKSRRFLWKATMTLLPLSSCSVP